MKEKKPRTQNPRPRLTKARLRGLIMATSYCLAGQDVVLYDDDPKDVKLWEEMEDAREYLGDLVRWMERRGIQVWPEEEVEEA